MQKEHIANNLNKERKAQNITQQDLATRVHVSRQTIISIEKGNYTPSVLLALKLAEELSLEINKLFYLKNHE